MAVPAPDRTRPTAGPLILAAAIPFLFLHRHYQPSLSVGQIDADLSDVAVAVVVAAGAWSWRHARVPVGWAALAVLVLLGVAWGSRYGGYPTSTHLVTAAKWLEYMLLAPAVAAIVRAERDLRPAVVVLLAWSLVATVVGVLQFFGALGDLEHTPAGRRKSSLLGYHDFSALSAAAVVLALLLLLTASPHRRAALAALVWGAAGMVIGGAFDAVVGLLLAAAVLVVALRIRDARKLALVAATLAVVFAGTLAIRSQAVADGLKFLGIKQGTGGAAVHVQSYRQRALLAYIGGRIFLAHPLTGVGWEGSSDAFAYRPYLADARRRFSQPPEAFPSPQHPWGVQNAYVQSLADLGVLGLLAFLAATAVPAVRAFLRRSRAAVGGAAVVAVALGVWNGFGLVAGIPLDALTWLGVGVCVASLHRPITPPV